jgi:pre-rRNA-processing protein IPI3
MLELGSSTEHEPERSLSNHRAGITALTASQGVNSDTSFCVSASKDKSCIVWNYWTGDALRTLLFPSFPLCVSMDPAARALFVSSDDGSLYLTEFFAEKCLLGPNAEDVSTVAQVTSFGVVPADAGPASCLSVSYDGTMLLTGHAKGQVLKWDVADNKTPVELANLNAAVTNVVFVPPLPSVINSTSTKAPTVIKPVQAERNYTLTTQFDSDLAPETRFDTLLRTTGLPAEVLNDAMVAVTQQQPGAGAGAAAAQTAGEQDVQAQNDELWEIVHEQRGLHRQMYQHLLSSRSS